MDLSDLCQYELTSTLASLHILLEETVAEARIQEQNDSRDLPF